VTVGPAPQRSSTKFATAVVVSCVIAAVCFLFCSTLSIATGNCGEESTWPSDV